MCENLSRINKRTRKSIETFGEYIGHESSGEVNTFFPEYPRVSIPDKFMQRKAMTKYLNEWLEELLCSSRNIEILAERSLGVIGKGDEDLRMREMTSEERESLKSYTEITEGVISFKRYMNVSCKKICHPSYLFIFRFLKKTFFGPPLSTRTSSYAKETANQKIRVLQSKL